MIQWFPGHMAKAFREVEIKSAIADLFIITLDARAPISTYNENFDKIAPTKPRLFVITKIDLADPGKVKKILQKFNHQEDQAIAINLKQPSAYKRILKEAQRLLAHKKEQDLAKGLLKPRLRALVLGVPNSGKSTLINRIAKKSIAKVGNKPGITRGQQWINAGEIKLLDTPGILWPKFDNELIGIKLAVIGSIKMEIVPQQELFNGAYKLLSKYYPAKIKQLHLMPATDNIEIYNNLITLCQNKHFFLKTGQVDIGRAITWFANYLKNLRGVTYD